MNAVLGAVPVLLSLLQVTPAASLASVSARPASAASVATVQADQLKSAIDRLGTFEYAERAAAARAIRRTPAPQAVAALVDAATGHKDGYVRFRALVLLTGFEGPATGDLMVRMLADPNDRLRQVAYRYFEHHPTGAIVGSLLGALEREHADFVRPALIRALAAAGSDPRVQTALVREIGRGDTVFRSAVIEALGDYRARYAAPALAEATKLDGSLMHDAALALGKLQDKAGLPVLAGLQKSAPPEAQPEVAAAICLLGLNCPTHLGYLDRVLRFGAKTPGYQPLVRGAARGLGAVAESGSREAFQLLIDLGSHAPEPLRGPIALAVGTVALRQPVFLLDALQQVPERAPALALLAEAFEMLEEDFEKERFFVTARAAYWGAAEGSPTRGLVQALFEKLDF